MKRAAIGAVAAAAIIVGATQLGPSGSATVHTFGPLVTLRPGVAKPAPQPAKLRIAHGETQSFQVLVSGSATVAPIITALKDSQGQRIGANRISIYREGYYNVTTPSDREGATGQWPDPLIPQVDPYYHETRNAFPVSTSGGGEVAIWVDVAPVRTQPAGTYTGSLRVAGQTVPISVEVLPITIPVTSTLSSIFPLSSRHPCLAHTGVYGCKGNVDQAWHLAALYATAGLGDRISISNPFPDTYGDSGAQRAPTGDASEPLFVKYALPLIKGTAATRFKGAELTSVLGYESCPASTCLAGWRSLAEQYGFADRFYLQLCDEPYANGKLWASLCNPNAARANAIWPGVKRIITTSPADAAANGASASIILAPPINDVTKPLAPGDLFYTSCLSYGCAGDASVPADDGWPGYAIDEPASEQEAMGWLAFEYGSSGELYYDTGAKLVSAWTDQFFNGGNGDGTLFYPGTPTLIGGTHDIPIDSIRLKRIRDGEQDYELLHLAEREGKRAQAMAIVHGLFGPPATASHNAAQSQAAMDSARDQLIALVLHS